MAIAMTHCYHIDVLIINIYNQRYYKSFFETYL